MRCPAALLKYIDEREKVSKLKMPDMRSILVRSLGASSFLCELVCRCSKEWRDETLWGCYGSIFVMKRGFTGITVLLRWHCAEVVLSFGVHNTLMGNWWHWHCWVQCYGCCCLCLATSHLSVHSFCYHIKITCLFCVLCLITREQGHCRGRRDCIAR